MTLGVLAFVPWVGLLALPVMCLLLVRVFHLTFARREEWPSTDESGRHSLEKPTREGEP
jgi:hypothetical protein